MAIFNIDENKNNKVIGTAVAKRSMKVRTNSSARARKPIGYINKGGKVEVLEILPNGWYKIVWNNASCGYAYTSNTGNKYYTYTANKLITTTSTSSVFAASGVIKAGTKYILNNTPIYSSATGRVIGKRSGVYYTWDEAVINNKVRMTSRLDRVGIKGQISFFVDTGSLK